MAEIVAKIRTTGKYEDDDLLDAFSDSRINRCHCEMICYEKDGSRSIKDMDANGLMPDGHLSQDYLEATAKFRFERLSKNEGSITRLSDLNVIQFTNDVPFQQHDGKIVHMEMDATISRRRVARQFPVFGSIGREIWYGGTRDMSDTAMDTVWTQITQKTGKLKKDHNLWPLGTQDVYSHFCCATETFSDAEIANLLEPEYEVDRNGDYKWETPSIADPEVKDVLFQQDEPDDGRSWRKVVLKKRRNKIQNKAAILSDIGISQGHLNSKYIAIDYRAKMTKLKSAYDFYDKVLTGTRKDFKEKR